MANETIGRVRCPRHGKAEVWGEVSKNKNSRLYYRCGTPALKWRDGCGLVDDAGANFQEWMLAHAELFGPGAPPTEDPPKDEPPAPAADHVVEPQPEVTPMADEKPIKKKTVVVPKAKKAPPKTPAAEDPPTDLQDGDMETTVGDAEDWLL